MSFSGKVKELLKKNGMTKAELAKDAGHTLVNLGPRILRCETAPLYALAAISYELEL